jgi:1-acyl-sn-glycerol-3-phosphate acyltransferase
MFNKNNRVFRQKWGKLQMLLLGITLDIEGNIDNDANMIIMNHQSILDIIVLEYLHTKNLAWVAKKEIANIPWFGRVLKAPDMIIIERENKSSLVKLLKESKEKYKDDRPIAIFPEGTRTNGTKLLKFQAGAKLIAQKYNFKVQPIVIVGTRKLFDSQNMKQSSGTVKIIYLKTVKAIKNTTWYEDMHLNMDKILQKELKRRSDEL